LMKANLNLSSGGNINLIFLFFTINFF
jgi:hypothetical protein